MSKRYFLSCKCTFFTYKHRYNFSHQYQHYTATIPATWDEYGTYMGEGAIFTGFVVKPNQNTQSVNMEARGSST
jgi:hypothetical protein